LPSDSPCLHPLFFCLIDFSFPLKGDYRFTHSRVITNAEEIAFYGGGETEKTIATERYFNLAKHTNKLNFFLCSFLGHRLNSWTICRIFRVRIWFNMFEDMLIKYAWSTIGLLAQAFPVFFPEMAAIAMETVKGESDSAAVRTEKYITNKRCSLTFSFHTSFSLLFL